MRDTDARRACVHRDSELPISCACAFAAKVLLAIAITAAALRATAAEIVLETSAVESLVKQTLFNDEGGRRYLLKGKCFAYLETPSVTVDNGRVSIRAHLMSHLGFTVGNDCVPGANFTSWITASGVPAVEGAKLRLEQISIDEVSDKSTQTLVGNGLAPALPRAIDYDVLQAVRKMLEGTKEGWQASVDSLTFSSISAERGKLGIQFDFRLSAR